MLTTAAIGAHWTKDANLQHLRRDQNSFSILSRSIIERALDVFMRIYILHRQAGQAGL